MKIKKVLAALLVGVLAVSLASCGGGSSGDDITATGELEIIESSETVFDILPNELPTMEKKIDTPNISVPMTFDEAILGGITPNESEPVSGYKRYIYTGTDFQVIKEGKDDSFSWTYSTKEYISYYDADKNINMAVFTAQGIRTYYDDGAITRYWVLKDGDIGWYNSNGQLVKSEYREGDQIKYGDVTYEASISVYCDVDGKVMCATADLTDVTNSSTININYGKDGVLLYTTKYAPETETYTKYAADGSEISEEDAYKYEAAYSNAYEAYSSII